VEFVESNVHQARDYKLIIPMIGGNEVSSGMSVQRLADRLIHAAKRIAQQPGVHVVIVCSLWPRSDKDFNKKAKEFTEMMEGRLCYDP
jgi:hypothetical protein